LIKVVEITVDGQITVKITHPHEVKIINTTDHSLDTTSKNGEHRI